MIPEFREVSDATRLEMQELSGDEKELVKATVPQSAISVPEQREGYPSQLGIHWQDDFTYVFPQYMPSVKDADKKETEVYKLIGYVSQADVVKEYQARHSV